MKEREKRPKHFVLGHRFLRDTVFKVKMRTVFPDITELSTFAYKK